MTGKVIKFYPPGSAAFPDAVLEQAKGQYESVLVIGFDKNDCLDVRSTINLTYGDMLWAIERFKHKMLNGDYFHADDEGKLDE